jgi:hypothetical protein
MFSSISVRTIARKTLARSRVLSIPKKSFSSSGGDKPVNPQERAQQLHNEIESIVQKHDSLHAEELQKAKGFGGFVGAWASTVLYVDDEGMNHVSFCFIDFGILYIIFSYTMYDCLFATLFFWTSAFAAVLSEFLKRNKTNISVIIVSFLTVVLSVKMVGTD